jgi:hypothetical protein
MAVLRALVIISWLLIASYTGVAGYIACKALENTSTTSADQSVEYKGINFENKESLQEFLHDNEGSKLFPWIFVLPQELAPLITSVAFGLLGGAGATLKKVTIDHTPIASVPVFTMPIFGAFVGVMLFFLSFLLPAIFVVGRNPARTETLIGLSLFGGGFSEQAFLWISEQVMGKVFALKTQKRPETAQRKA